MSAILILKPIIDALYEDMREYKQNTDRRIKELERELYVLRNQKKTDVVSKNVVIVDDSEDDDEFANEAKAKPVATTSPITQVEIKNETNNNTTFNNEDIKVIKTVKGKDRKDYMKEYQRNYRKKQKEIILN